MHILASNPMSAFGSDINETISFMADNYYNQISFAVTADDDIDEDDDEDDEDLSLDDDELEEDADVVPDEVVPPDDGEVLEDDLDLDEDEDEDDDDDLI